MRRIRKHFTFANVASAIALFVALGGGTAIALNGSNTVQSDDLGPGAQVKAPDVADNAVNSADVKDGSLSVADLGAGSRPHMLNFSVPNGTAKTPIATSGNAQLSGECGGVGPALYIYLKNVSSQTGTMNVLNTQQTSSDGGVTVFTTGQFVGAGDEFTVDYADDTAKRALAGGNFHRSEGQIVFQTPNRVTTINFHAFTTGSGGNRCEFYGTAVTSNVS